jgi:hypothetical protein
LIGPCTLEINKNLKYLTSVCASHTTIRIILMTGT